MKVTEYRITRKSVQLKPLRYLRTERWVSGLTDGRTEVHREERTGDRLADTETGTLKIF